MKKIIHGKMYDTETARLIKAEDSDSMYPSLYRKRTGEYFLGGEGIEPLTYAQAKEWAEIAMTAEEYETEFGKVTEGELAHLHISLPADVADRIRKTAAQEGISVSECIGRRF